MKRKPCRIKITPERCYLLPIKWGRAYTHEEVREATDEFEKNGGLITYLPPQPSRVIDQVGANHGAYDTPENATQ